MNPDLSLDLPGLLTELLSLFSSTPVYSFLENLSNSGPLGQIVTVPIIMALTALVMAIPALVVMGIVVLVRKFTKRRRTETGGQR